MSKSTKLPPTTDENEVLRRMLHTPPKPHKPKRQQPQTKGTRGKKP